MKKFLCLISIFIFLSPFSLFAELITNESINKKEAPPIEYVESNFWYELANMLLTLSVILVLLFSLIWIMKKMQTSRIKFHNDSSIIKIIDHRPLSAKTGLYLIEIKGKEILISDSPTGVTHLTDL